MSLFDKICIRFAKSIAKINVKRYMSIYTKRLIKLGVKIPKYNGVGYIDPSCFIDSSAFNLITIGKNVTISRNVTLLTHDFSIGKGLEAINSAKEGERYKFLKPISIGDNCFIGANAFILPGTSIGCNCIIGSGAVVKGAIPDYSVCAGNPAKVIADTREWAQKHFEKADYLVISANKRKE